jgi:MFS family permease
VTRCFYFTLNHALLGPYSASEFVERDALTTPALSKNSSAPYAHDAWAVKWFSVSAVVPTLRASQGLSDARAAWLSSSVSIGFVAGTIVSALFGLADRFDPRRLFMMAAVAGAAANAAILMLDPGSVAAILLRFFTGAAMAWIYPVGIRIVATWATGDTGLITAIVTAALCVGSGLPYLIDALGGLDWKVAVGGASALSALSGALVNVVRLGPRHVQLMAFRFEFVATAWRDLPIRLANIGYCGHKWENYAMWTWISTYLLLSYEISQGQSFTDANYFSRVATFSVFLISAVGAMVAGYLSDRAGRTLVAMTAVFVSGTCCLLAPLIFGGPTWLVTFVVLIWAFALIADSAQFSASIIELSDHAFVGTMLTVQTCIGYLVTLVSIHIVQMVADAVGWRYALATLAIGPALSFFAMRRLRHHPDAIRLAMGRR